MKIFHIRKMIIFVPIIFFLLSCDGPKLNSNAFPGNNGSTINPGAPTTDTNSLIYGNVVSQGQMTIDFNFKDTLSLKGKEINLYLNNTTNRSSLCSLFPFPDQKLVLVLAAKVDYFQQLNQPNKEFFYRLTSLNPQENRLLCETTAVKSYINTYYATSTIAYQVSDVCLSCTGPALSKGLVVITPAGVAPPLTTNHLSLKLDNLDSTINDKNRCTQSSQCPTLGFNCCIQGQCVQDGATRSSVDKTSLEYLQALNEIQNLKSAKNMYPQFFFVCPINPYSTAIPTIPPDEPSLFTLRKQLFDCTTPSEGEMSVCTKTYNDADSLIAKGSTTFITGNDDRNFNKTYMGTDSSKMAANSIVEVIYGGATITPSSTYSINAAGNDDLDTPQQITITARLPSTATDKSLKIRYKIDGSCEPFNAKNFVCTKYYIQGENSGKVYDHDPATLVYKLPYYADMTQNIIVTVNGNPSIKNKEWMVNPDGTNSIVFISPTSTSNTTNRLGREIYLNDLVKIKYFVVSAQNNPLQAKKLALDEISLRCNNCDGRNPCRFVEVYDSSGTQVVNYACSGGNANPDVIPTIYVDTRSSPLRYYDTAGKNYDNPSANDPQQEGTQFFYKDTNIEHFLRPNNIETDTTGVFVDIGVNEIYGSYLFNKNSPKPPKVVDLVKDQEYDIFTNNGSYSTRLSQEADYDRFDDNNRLFPNTLIKVKGGGYIPNKSSLRKPTDFAENGNFRADDLLFGRACFVPLTMIPWSHSKKNSVETQRRARLKTQHFLFANGYQRDWFGFDYGSLIGSFDGTTWFSIGSDRRIKAKSNKLYLAVNAYFGELALNSTYVVQITKVVKIAQAGSQTRNDIDSKGAECQRHHFCTDDTDCITQLGWDYSCVNISGIKSRWPVFDPYGNEIQNAEVNDRLINIFGTMGNFKRCMYRGRGAPCQKNIDDTNASGTFSQLPATNDGRSNGHNICNMNSYCQTFADGNGGYVANFNRRIARFGHSVKVQSLSSDINPNYKGDTFGLGAKIIGRPFNYIGKETVPIDVLSNFSSNNVKALCLPGRSLANPDSTTLKTQHYTEPPLEYKGDKILNIGMSNNNLQPDYNYVSSCPTLGVDGFYVHKNLLNKNVKINDSQYSRLASSQSFSTNILSIFGTRANQQLLFGGTMLNSILAPMLQQNRCLRAAGSPCFSDWDCGPNQFIADSLSNVTSGQVNINDAELNYWKEALTCGQAVPTTSSKFDLTKNLCCRASGQVTTIATNVQPIRNLLSNLPTPIPTISTSEIAGIDMPLDTFRRYSKIAPIYYNTYYSTNGSQLLPFLKTAPLDQCGDTTSSVAQCAQSSTLHPLNQFITLSAIGKKTCCSQNWVRNFDQTNWGGGHQWNSNFRQYVPKDSLRCLAWSPTNTDPDGVPFSCSNPAYQTCNARSIGENEAKVRLEFLTSLELLGIPQVLIKTNDQFYPADQKVTCFVGTDTDLLPIGSTSFGEVPIPNTIKVIGATAPFGVPEFAFNNGSSSYLYYTANDPNNFAMGTKGGNNGLLTMFSDQQFTCCLPTQITAYDFPVTSDMCCTGNLDPKVPNRCCLPDYVNISVYLNRYVSSEAQDLDSSLFDAYTGMPLLLSDVLQISKAKNLCCSGSVAQGVAVDSYPIPGSDVNTASNKVRRFIYLSTDKNAALYDLGRRWNNDLYCVPASGGTSGGTTPGNSAGNI